MKSIKYQNVSSPSIDVKRRHQIVTGIILLLGFIFIQSCQSSPEAITVQESVHPNIEKLKKQSSEFIQEIIQLNENVYVAVGFDGSNASMVIGKDGVVIKDALRALGAAEKVAEKFKKISNKPVKAVIYTHGHEDHTGGTSAFIDNSNEVKIIAREGFKEELEGNSPVEPLRNLADQQINAPARNYYLSYALEMEKNL
ncbi:MBL fold metallo-hydrolase [uncultured Cyclobacterium sp.]|uniref:MBL fold metallo-hydrolase n=1 Tax=uncultured Cyclobacterium sp. TaxID=453820 RepID=UPI0030EEDC7E|tara:strand:+ start:35371 stop:35964 length:594 start_codon:yes stop_codon:yes gene_type:complete